MSNLTKDKIKNRAESVSFTTTTPAHRSTFNYARVVELRKDVVQQMGYYCAELSQTLMYEFAEKIAERFMGLPINKQLEKTLTRYENQIIDQGLFESGQDIIADMKSIVQA